MRRESTPEHSDTELVTDFVWAKRKAGAGWHRSRLQATEPLQGRRGSSSVDGSCCIPRPRPRRSRQDLVPWSINAPPSGGAGDRSMPCLLPQQQPAPPPASNDFSFLGRTLGLGRPGGSGTDGSEPKRARVGEAAGEKSKAAARKQQARAERTPAEAATARTAEADRQRSRRENETPPEPRQCSARCQPPHARQRVCVL